MRRRPILLSNDNCLVLYCKDDFSWLLQVEDPLALRGEVWDAKAGAEKRRNRAWAANTDGPVA